MWKEGHSLTCICLRQSAGAWMEAQVGDPGENQPPPAKSKCCNLLLWFIQTAREGFPTKVVPAETPWGGMPCLRVGSLGCGCVEGDRCGHRQLSKQRPTAPPRQDQRLNLQGRASPLKVRKQLFSLTLEFLSVGSQSPAPTRVQGARCRAQPVRWEAGPPSTQLAVPGTSQTQQLRFPDGPRGASALQSPGDSTGPPLRATEGPGPAATPSRRRWALSALPSPSPHPQLRGVRSAVCTGPLAPFPTPLPRGPRQGLRPMPPPAPVGGGGGVGLRPGPKFGCDPPRH